MARLRTPSERRKLAKARRKAEEAHDDDEATEIDNSHVNYAAPSDVLSEELMLDADAIIDGALETLHNFRLKLPKRPVTDGGYLEPELPDDLSKVSTADLCQLMNDFARMADYVEPTLALLDGQDAITSQNEKVIQKIEYLRSNAKSQKDREALSIISKQTLLKGARALQRRAEKSLTKAVLERYIRGYKVLSRELTRRTSQLDALRERDQ